MIMNLSVLVIMNVEMVSDNTWFMSSPLMGFDQED